MAVVLEWQEPRRVSNRQKEEGKHENKTSSWEPLCHCSQGDATRTCFRQRSEPFLAASVPNLKADAVLATGNVFVSKIDSSASHILVSCSIYELRVQRCFATP